MRAILRLPNGDDVIIERNQILIGESPDCQVRLRGLAPQHAKITNVAGRWLLESQGDWAIKRGNDKPSRKSWLESGDMIHLTPSGPSILFQAIPSSPATEIPTTQVVMTELLEEAAKKNEQEQQS